MIQALILLIGLTFASATAAEEQSFETKSDGNKLGLSILGAIVGREEVSSNNVVLVKEHVSGRVRAVKRGFKLLDKFLVEEIHPKYIVIVDDKQRHLVYQSKFASEFQETPKSSAPLNQSLHFAEEGFERQDNRIQMTAMYRDRLINEQLSAILMQATALPHMVDGQIRGFRILQIDEGSIFQKAGLENQDVVKSINDQPLTDAGAAISLLQSLRGASQMRIVLERNGQTQEIEVTVD